MENGGVAGLPAAYILQQLTAFKTGARRSADPRKANANEMVQIARALTDDEAKAAADYFASMKWRPWVRVVESETAPAVRSTTNGLFMPIAGRRAIPLGHRIIEMPENPEHTDVMRDPHSGFVAYVPIGSIAKARRSRRRRAGKTTQCTLCHGADLKGSATCPGCGPHGQLHDAAALGHETGCAQEPGHGADRREARRRGHDQRDGVRGFTDALMPSVSPARDS
jgi:cytochrome c553